MALGLPMPMLYGADVSAYQPNLGPNSLDFIIVKATQGTGFRDPNFQMHVQTAHARNQLVFAYHFGELNEGPGGAQNFLATIAPVIGLLSGVMYDCEFQDPASTYGPLYSDATAWNNVVATQHPALQRFLYTYSGYWAGHIGNPPALPGTRLWWAHIVPNQVPDVAALAAQVTKPPFPDLPWPDYAIRQIGDAGSVGGVSPIDIDISYLTRAELAGTPETDMTPAESALLTATAKAVVQIGAAVNVLAAAEATRSGLVEHGDGTHYGFDELKADMATVKTALTKIPGGTVDGQAIATAVAAEVKTITWKAS